ncbi:MAG TPA: nuclear transport factor 2 family protein [Acidimicrobiales bacterium]|jgi:ketosteroid isomerase-like protein|nr:nuclear transport factor 2 family protein [Acidimicrobiales bacterium]
MDKYPPHPARDMAVRSVTAVERGDREAWLELFAEDAVVEDPIGVSSFDAEGKGQRGLDAIAAFYDNVISQAPVRFTVRESYAAGDECANVYTITTELDGGVRAVIDGVFTYRLDEDGKLASMRGFWETDRMRIEGST